MRQLRVGDVADDEGLGLGVSEQHPAVTPDAEPALAGPGAEGEILAHALFADHVMTEEVPRVVRVVLGHLLEAPRWMRVKPMPTVVHSTISANLNAIDGGVEAFRRLAHPTGTEDGPVAEERRIGTPHDRPLDGVGCVEEGIHRVGAEGDVPVDHEEPLDARGQELGAHHVPARGDVPGADRHVAGEDLARGGVVGDELEERVEESLLDYRRATDRLREPPDNDPAVHSGITTRLLPMFIVAVPAAVVEPV